MICRHVGDPAAPKPVVQAAVAAAAGAAAAVAAAAGAAGAASGGHDAVLAAAACAVGRLGVRRELRCCPALRVAAAADHVRKHVAVVPRRLLGGAVADSANAVIEADGLLGAGPPCCELQAGVGRRGAAEAVLRLAAAIFGCLHHTGYPCGACSALVPRCGFRHRRSCSDDLCRQATATAAFTAAAAAGHCDRRSKAAKPAARSVLTIRRLATLWHHDCTTQAERCPAHAARLHDGQEMSIGSRGSFHGQPCICIVCSVLENASNQHVKS